MKFGTLTLAAGALIAMASLSVPASGAGLIGAARPDTNVIQAHYDHRDCQSEDGRWHRHKRNGDWRDCSPPSYSGPPAYYGPAPYYGPGPYAYPYAGPQWRRPGIGIYLGTGGGTVLSDARLKSNVVRLASLDNGIGLYEYSLIGETRRRIGVMAQEVAESAPDAVLRNRRGYLMVDYGALFSDPAMVRALERSGYRLAP